MLFIKLIHGKKDFCQYLFNFTTIIQKKKTKTTNDYTTPYGIKYNIPVVANLVQLIHIKVNQAQSIFLFLNNVIVKCGKQAYGLSDGKQLKAQATPDPPQDLL